MKGLGVIRFFTIALLLACAYQFSFNFLTSSVESKAREFAKGKKALEQRYLDSVSSDNVINLGIIKYTYEQAKSKQISLGLDLQGGMNVIMEVSVPDLVRALSNFSTDPAFNKALAQAREDQKSSQKDFVDLFANAWEREAQGRSMAAIFATKDNQGRITYQSSNSEVVVFLKKEANDAIDRSFKILRTRIDKFGVTQPNIQRQKGSGRIIIELPGVTNVARVRKLLVGTASLEFWETYDNQELAQRVIDANKLVKAELDREKLARNGGVKPADTATATAAASTTDSAASGLLNKFGSDTASKKTDKSKLAANAKNAQENPLFNVFYPAIGQNKAIPGPIVGYSLPKDTSTVNRYFSLASVRNSLPRDLRLMWTVKPINEESKALGLVAIRVSSRDGRAKLDGSSIENARADVGQNGGNEISMQMNAQGARIWQQMTGENIGKSIAVVLDNNVYTYPRVNGEISGGRSSITGGFSTNEAKDLSNILEAGKMPAPARIVQEAVVGPSLGEQAINAGVISSIAGFLIIVLTMYLWYRKAGLVANVALIINLFLVFGVLSSFAAVLTLPGIAGIVLTMATAVDANILIFERVKDEMRHGKTMREAIPLGFKHAASAILDSNITTLAVGIILYIFGTGPIQGFATTLIIGILTSLFSAILVSRLMFEFLLRRGIDIDFYASYSKNALQNVNIDFMGRRKIFYAISSVIILAGMVSMFTRGFSLGVDFSGGRSYVVDFKKVADPNAVRANLQKAFINEGKESSVEVKTFGSDEKYKITTSYRSEDETTQASDMAEQRLYDGLKPLVSGAPTLAEFRNNYIQSSEKVGATIVDDIKQSAVLSIIFAIVIISIYILVRFRKWQYSLGAAVALIHDALMILSIFSLLHGILPFSMDLDQSFIAAILTVIGYSVLDTVVIFDRVREHAAANPNDHSEKLYNSAINSTLSRTVLTSSLTIAIVAILFIFGGDVIRGFSFALLFGLIAGTYSSVLIAVPIVLDLDPDKGKTDALPKQQMPTKKAVAA